LHGESETSNKHSTLNAYIISNENSLYIFQLNAIAHVIYNHFLSAGLAVLAQVQFRRLQPPSQWQTVELWK